MAKKINGITIAINADTSGVTAGLKDLTSKSVSLSKQLKTVDSLLKLDPTNTELLATKQKLLADSVETSRKKLEALKGAQEDVKKSVASGSIGTDEYIAFQGEIVKTEQRLKDLGEQGEDTGKDVEQLGDETKKTGDKMQDADTKSGKFADALKSGVAVAAEAAAAALAAVTAAAVGTVAAVVKATGDFAEYGDEIDKNSQKLGMSAEAYQEWDFIMQHAGSDIDKMGTSMKKLAEAVENPTAKSTEAFEKLGISLEDAQKMSQEDLFKATITALQGMESGTERTALANDLLGKSAMDLGALLNTSAEETEEMRQRLHDLGGVLSDDAVKSAAGFQDSLLDVQTAIKGVKNNIASQFVPSMTKMFNATTKIASGNEEAISELEDGIDEFVGNVEQMATKIAKMAEKIIPIVVKMIAKKLPELAQTAVKIIKTLASALAKQLPDILKAGVQIVLELVDGISKELPTLVPAAVGMILELVNGLLDNMDKIIDAGLSLVLGLVDGIVNSLPLLVDQGPVIIGKLIDGIVDAVPKLLDGIAEMVDKIGSYLMNPENQKKMFQAGVDIITKIWNGIKSIKLKILGWFSDLAEKICDKIGIGDYYRKGKKIIQDLWDGMKEIWEKLKKWLGGVADTINEKIGGVGDLISLAKSNFSIGGGVVGLARFAYKKLHNAKGGIYNVPTTATIGENGAEAVVPLENNTAWIDKLAARLNRSGGGYSAQITVNVYGNNMSNIGNDIAAKIDTALRKFQVQQVRGQGGTAWA